MKLVFEDDGTTIDVPVNRALADICDQYSTPLLFSCRNAMCGTCLIEVTQGGENLSTREEAELELLEVLAPGNERARLACQTRLLGDARVRRLL